MKIQTETVAVRLTKVEKSRVSAAAKKAKLPIATYVRVVLNAHLEAKKSVGVMP